MNGARVIWKYNKIRYITIIKTNTCRLFVEFFSHCYALGISASVPAYTMQIPDSNHFEFKTQAAVRSKRQTINENEILNQAVARVCYSMVFDDILKYKLRSYSFLYSTKIVSIRSAASTFRRI